MKITPEQLAELNIINQKMCLDLGFPSSKRGIALGVISEMGELANAISKHLGLKKVKQSDVEAGTTQEAIGSELADVLVYLFQGCDPVLSCESFEKSPPCGEHHIWDLVEKLSAFHLLSGNPDLHYEKRGDYEKYHIENCYDCTYYEAALFSVATIAESFEIDLYEAYKKKVDEIYKRKFKGENNEQN